MTSLPFPIKRHIGQHFNRYTLRRPELIVLHWTAGPGDAYSLQRYLDTTKDDGSYQYGVDGAGHTLEYVDPTNVAWHAGDGDHGWNPQTLHVSTNPEIVWRRWETATLTSKALGSGPGLAHAYNKDGTIRINHASIGIGLCNRGPMGAARGGLPGSYDRPGFSWTHFQPYTPAQVASLDCLVEYLAERFPSLRFVCGHQDIAHGKGDPGPLLADWTPPPSTGLARIVYDWKARAWHLSTAQQHVYKAVSPAQWGCTATQQEVPDNPSAQVLDSPITTPPIPAPVPTPPLLTPALDTPFMGDDETPATSVDGGVL